MTTGSEIKVSLATAGEMIGAVTFWSLRGAHAKREELRADLASLGLVMPKDPKPQLRIRYALESARRKNDEPIVYDRVSDSKTEMVFAISSKSTDEQAEQAVYQHRTRVRLNKATGVLTLEDPADHTLQVVRDRYEELETYASVLEVGAALTTALQGRTANIGLGGVNLRGHSGGVYFVPAPNVDRLNALAEIIDRVAGFGAMTVWPIPAGDRVVLQTHAAVSEDFVDQVRRTKLSVQVLCDELSERESMTDKPKLTAESRQVIARASAINALRARADLFADILGDMRDDLLAQVREMERLIEERVGALQPVPEDFEE